MTVEICPKFDKCPLYNEQISTISEITLNIYKKNYCLAGRNNFTQCKRFQTSEAIHKSPPLWVLPNCTLSVEEIAQKIKEQEAEQNSNSN